MFLVLFCSRRTAYVARDNAKKLHQYVYSKIFYVFDVVYIKSSNISCEFSGLNVVATLERKRRIFVSPQPKGCCPYSPEKGSPSFSVTARPKF